ncbi:MAG: SufD family Fe-S cluster assembly protein [Methanomicrobiaceae archaeon]|uniref:Iron-sulfur cluster assembly protein sufb n=1 Tax=hydrocarbon metagenome TaxID=938273 RepID=A0A0W8FKI6_9ZZZZ|nr:SufD family Fe-S cluster assembly protein [Methanomicrobiaceae archaeon]MDD5419695.1 SufD family Fe-S cluster assembly protein [Methanomicrobiaceae archaeon]
MTKDSGEIESLSEEDRERLALTGLDLEMTNRCGSFFQIDQDVVHTSCAAEGIEVIPIAAALEKYDWLADYAWKAVPRDKDKYTKYVARQEQPAGVVIIARKGSRSIMPLQACLLLQRGRVQHVHNIIIAEEGAEIHLISGCASATHTERGSHLGVSEFYVGKNAKVTSTMIHSWSRHINVFPRSAAIIEEGGIFLSNYVCMQPVHRIQMYPAAHLVGKDGIARFSSIVMGMPGSHLDIGSRAVLAAEGTSAELVTRAITTGGTIVSRGHVIGAKNGTRGHIECRGLILKDGTIHAIPEIEGQLTGTELSHEAAVGKIARHEIEYLMSRGLDEEEATATIIRGFLDVKISGLPAVLQKQIDEAIDKAESGF